MAIGFGSSMDETDYYWDYAQARDEHNKLVTELRKLVSESENGYVSAEAVLRLVNGS